MGVTAIATIDELQAIVRNARQSGQTVGVVPTMGALHAGHLSLVENCLARADLTIVTIFLNPTQFAPSEDLENYPRTLDADLEKLESVGVQYVFAPTAELMYPPNFSTAIVPPAVAKTLEGEFRPHHFRGVATVVLKLLNLTQADLAFFGQKDFQQVAVIKQMVADLNVPTEICVCPIVRDADGLALSSRNIYLSPEQREIALSLNRTLIQAKHQIESGLRDGFEVITQMRQSLIDGGVESIDYAVVANPQTLQTADPIQGTVVALVAAYVGTTRLIDNQIIDV